MTSAFVSAMEIPKCIAGWIHREMNENNFKITGEKNIKSNDLNGRIGRASQVLASFVSLGAATSERVKNNQLLTTEVVSLASQNEATFLPDIKISADTLYLEEDLTANDPQKGSCFELKLSVRGRDKDILVSASLALPLGFEVSVDGEMPQAGPVVLSRQQVMGQLILFAPMNIAENLHLAITPTLERGASLITLPPISLVLKIKLPSFQKSAADSYSRDIRIS